MIQTATGTTVPPRVWLRQFERSARYSPPWALFLGKKVRGPHSQIYCGGAKPRGARKRCRNVLLKTLRVAVEQTSKEQASDDPAAWKVQAICDDGCDTIEPTELGAVGTPPFPWQNRGTFHQVVEMSGHR